MHKVRWNTPHEVDDISELYRSVGDDFAIALDRNGWQITMKPECRDEDRTDECKWPMRALSDCCPEWAVEIASPTGERRQIGYRPYPSKLPEFLGAELRRFLPRS